MGERWTQRMTLHLNCGEDGTHLHYDVYCDGAKTPIFRRIQTNGRPHYKKTADLFCCGNHTYDMLRREAHDPGELPNPERPDAWLERMHSQEGDG